MKPIDFGNLPPIPFHFAILIAMSCFGFGVYLFLKDLWLGVVSSLGIQFVILEIQYWSFYFMKHRSGVLQIFIMILSFFFNLMYLVVFGISLGTYFILGFFLAYFVFIGIFVISAIFTTRFAFKNP